MLYGDVNGIELRDHHYVELEYAEHDRDFIPVIVFLKTSEDGLHPLPDGVSLLDDYKLNCYFCRFMSRNVNF